MLVSIHKPILFLLLLLLIGSSAKSQIMTLQQCIDTALIHNKNLMISRNQLELSREKELEAVAGWYPKLNANADYRYFIELPYQLMPMSVFGGEEGKFKEAQFGVPHNMNAALQFSMPLYQPRLNSAVRSARIGNEISGLQYRKTTEQVVMEVTGLYYNAQVLQSQLAFVKNNLGNNAKLLANMQLLKEQLMATGTDINKVSLQMEKLNTELTQLQSYYQQLLNKLKFTMGLSLDQTVQVNDSITFDPKDDYTLSPATDLELSKAQGKLLSSEMNTLQSSNKPSLSLYGSYGIAGMGFDKSPNAFLNFYRTGFAGLQLTVPLFNGNITNRKIKQKSLELQNNSLQQNLLEERIQLEVINARNQKTVAQHSVQTTRSQTRLAQSIYDQTLLQQKQGLASLTDLLLADNNLQEAQQKHLAAMVDYLKADLDLKMATGNILNK